MRTRTTTSVVALSAVALVLAGCSAPGPGADPDPSTASDSTFSAPAGPVPAGLEAFVNANPISHLVSASRGLMEGNVESENLIVALGTAALFTAIFAPLTNRLYRRS